MQQSPLLRRFRVAESTWVRRGLIALMIALALVYLQCAGFGVFESWDDQLYVWGRPETVDWFGASWRHRLLTPGLGYPSPLPTFVYYVFHAALGDNYVVGLHLLNVAIHLVNTLLVFLVAKRWLSGEEAALAVASLWASHPLVVESVAWLTDLKVLLLGMGVWGALACWESLIRRASWPSVVGVLVGFGLALASRPEAIVLPVAMVVRVAVVDHQRFRCRRVWGVLASTAIIVAIYLPIAFLGQHQLVGSLGNGQDFLNLSLQMRWMRVGAALWLQISHVLVPLDLHPVYFPYTETLALRAAGGAAVGAALIALTAWAWFRQRRIFWGLAVWWIFYLPASGIELLPRFTADTYMYLPLVGLIVAFVTALESRVAGRAERTKLWAGLTVTAVAVLLLVSFTQISRWQNTQTLFEPVMRDQPEAPLPYRITAQHFLNVEQPEKALAYYKRGYGPLYDNGLIDLGMIRALELTGSPQQAADVALRLYQPAYSGTPPDGLDVYFAGLLAQYELALPTEEQPRELIAHIIARAAEPIAQKWPPGLIARLASHLASQRAFASAAELVDRGLEHHPQACSIWRIKTGLPASADAGRDRLPKSCRGAE